MPISLKEVEKDFAVIVEAILNGERAPKSKPFGPLRADAISALYASGRIEGQIYALNFRVFKILTGPHRGKFTAPRPGETSPPYKVIGKVTRVDGKIVPRLEAPPPGQQRGDYAGKIAP